jgi:hypothetical protein
VKTGTTVDISAVFLELMAVMEPMFYGWMLARYVFPELSQSLSVFEDRTYDTNENSK